MKNRRPLPRLHEMDWLEVGQVNRDDGQSKVRNASLLSPITVQMTMFPTSARCSYLGSELQYLQAVFGWNKAGQISFFVGASAEHCKSV